jgi:hypothetical protein
MAPRLLCVVVVLFMCSACDRVEGPTTVGRNQANEGRERPVRESDVVGIWEGQAEVGVGYVCFSIMSNYTSVVVWIGDARGAIVWDADWQLSSNVLTCVPRGVGGGIWKGRVSLGHWYGDDRVPTFSRIRHGWSPGSSWFNVWRKEDLDLTRQTVARLLEEAKSRATTGPDQEGEGIQSGRITTSRQETSGL